MNAAEKKEVSDAVAELKQSVAFKTGAGRVRRPVARLEKLIAPPPPAPTPPPPPPPPPPPQRTIFDRKGAFSTNVGALSPGLVAEAGITAVAPQITSLNTDNNSTRANVAQLDVQQGRFGKDVAIGGWGTHGSDPSSGYRSDPGAEAALVAARCKRYGLAFYIADTERHHLQGERTHTDALLAELRRLLGTAFPLAVCTFAYSPHSQGQLHASNVEACAKHGAAFIGEAYGPRRQEGGVWLEDGATWGIENVVGYMIRDSAQLPLRVAIGDKSVPVDVAGLQRLGPAKVSGVWVWAAEQAAVSLRDLNRLTL